MLMQHTLLTQKDLHKGTLEVLNKTITLLSVKDPLSYQAIAAMESPVSDQSEEYLPQDDTSELERYQKLRGIDNDGNDWYEPGAHGDFDFDIGPAGRP
jgi:hypothetical protein